VILQVDGDSIAHNMDTAYTSSAATALPTLKNGDPAKYVHCSVEAATTAPIGWIRFGTSAVANVSANGNNSIAIYAKGDGIVFNVSGCSHFKTMCSGNSVNMKITPIGSIAGSS